MGKGDFGGAAAAATKDACDVDHEGMFNRWLHPRLSKAEAVVLGLLLTYWVVLLPLSHFAYPAIIVVVILTVLLMARLLGGWQQRDGEMWCVAILTCQAVEGLCVAGVQPPHMPAIASSWRLQHRELSFVVYLLIGLVHGTQPLSARTRLLTGLFYELLFLLWLAPLWAFKAISTSADPLLPNGDSIRIAEGAAYTCAGAFAAGLACVHVLLQQACKPLWLASREHSAAAEAATRRQEQLTVEKERLYFEMKLAKHQLSKLQSQKDNYGDDRNDPRRRSENEDEEGEAAASCDSSSELNGLPLSTCGTHPELADADEAGTSTRDGNCEDCEDGCGNCERIPTYQVLTEFVNERLQSGSSVEYCSRAAVRERHQLFVRDGLLVDRKGNPLNPRAPTIGGSSSTAAPSSQPPSSPNSSNGGSASSGAAATSTSNQNHQHAIYVLSVSGDVLVSFEHSRHRHSSLVAGAPVRAAGSLLVENGHLLAFDNLSGHYRPPAKSLDVFTNWLVERGVPMSHVRVSSCEYTTRTPTLAAAVHAASTPGSSTFGDREAPHPHQLGGSMDSNASSDAFPSTHTQPPLGMVDSFIHKETVRPVAMQPWSRGASPTWHTI